MKILISAAPLLALAGCGSPAAETANPGQNLNATAEATPSIAIEGNAAGQTSAMPAKQFAETAAASDAYELASSKLALEKAQDTGLKAFAQQMMRDHTESTADLKVAAGSIVPDATLTAKHRSDITLLESASGSGFAAYKSQQIAAHEQALALLQAYATSGDQPELTAFAAKTAPVVAGHLKMLTEM